MYNSTGLADDQFDALYERLKAAIRNSLKQDKKPVQIPTVLGIIGGTRGDVEVSETKPRPGRAC